MAPTLAGELGTLDPPPVLLPARDRLRREIAEGARLSELVLTLESDPGLAIRVLALANRGPRHRSIASASEAARALTPAQLGALVESAPVTRLGMREHPSDRLRLHALAVQSVTARLCDLLGNEGDRDVLLTAALLHDVGKLALYEHDVSAAAALHAREDPPEQRAAAERRAFGADHAELGGAMARRWGFGERLCAAIERHHSASDPEDGALVRLADLLAHYAHGRRVELPELVALASRLTLSLDAVSELMYELPGPITTPRRGLDPCPLSDRERTVLQRLAEGKVYKQIAAELDVSSSTIRSHLHRIYTRIGVADRTQAVLVATDRGWI